MLGRGILSRFVGCIYVVHVDHRLHIRPDYAHPRSPVVQDFNGALFKCLLHGIAPVGHESKEDLKEKLALSMMWSRDDYTDYLLERID